MSVYKTVLKKTIKYGRYPAFGALAGSGVGLFLGGPGDKIDAMSDGAIIGGSFGILKNIGGKRLLRGATAAWKAIIKNDTTVKKTSSALKYGIAGGAGLAAGGVAVHAYDQHKDVIFRRIRGRIVPIRVKSSNARGKK